MAKVNHSFGLATTPSARTYLYNAIEMRGTSAIQETLEYLKTALAHYPNESMLWFEQALLQSTKGQMDAEALVSFDMAYRFSPGLPIIARAYADFLTNTGDSFTNPNDGSKKNYYGLAERLYMEVRQKEGDTAALLFSLGFLYVKTDEPYLASACYGRYRETDPENELAGAIYKEFQRAYPIPYNNSLWAGFQDRAWMVLTADPRDPTAAQPNLRLDNKG